MRCKRPAKHIGEDKRPKEGSLLNRVVQQAEGCSCGLAFVYPDDEEANHERPRLDEAG
jgi:hypothetical protein